MGRADRGSSSIIGVTCMIRCKFRKSSARADYWVQFDPKPLRMPVQKYRCPAEKFENRLLGPTNLSNVYAGSSGVGFGARFILFSCATTLLPAAGTPEIVRRKVCVSGDSSHARFRPVFMRGSRKGDYPSIPLRHLGGSFSCPGAGTRSERRLNGGL